MAETHTNILLLKADITDHGIKPARDGAGVVRSGAQIDLIISGFVTASLTHSPITCIIRVWRGPRLVSIRLLRASV